MLHNPLFKLSVLLAILLMSSSCFQRIDTEIQLGTPFPDVNTQQIDDLLLEMTVEQKIGQLIIGKASLHYEWEERVLEEWLENGKIGGLLLENLALEKYLDFYANSRELRTLPPFFLTNQKVALHNQFSNLPKFPTPSTISTVDSIAIQKLLTSHYVKQCKGLGINMSFSPSLFQNNLTKNEYDFHCFESDPIESMGRSIRNLQALKEQRILTIGDAFIDFSEVDNLDSLLNKYEALIETGLSGLVIGKQIFEIDTFKNLPQYFLEDFFRKELNYNGLILSNVSEEIPLDKAFHAGSDLFVTFDAAKTFDFLKEMYEEGKFSKIALNQKVRKVLLAKSWMNGGVLDIDLRDIQKPAYSAHFSQNRNTKLISQKETTKASWNRKKRMVTEYFHDPVWAHFIRMIYEQSAILANNPKNIIPYLDLYAKDFRIIQFSNKHLETLKNTFSKYAPFASYLYRPNSEGKFSGFDLNNFRWSLPVFILDDVDLQSADNQNLIESINKLSRKTNAVLINFGNPYNLQYFDTSLTTIQVFEKNEITEAYAARILFGGANSNGKLPVQISEKYPFGKGLISQIIRLEYSEPEDVGIQSERLGGIDTLVQYAIDDSMTPGCQILIAKDGHVVFSQAYGKHTYSEVQKVKTSDLYDLASITKIAATTISTMKMVDEGKIELESTLQNYFSNIDSVEVKNILIQELLTHQSGLQANMPIGNYLRKSYRIEEDCNEIFCREKRDEYQIQVSKNLFFNELHKDTIWTEMLNLEIGDKGKFIYSDVNFNFLQKIIELQEKTSLNDYTFQNFYKPLGMQRVAYHPLKTFQTHEIVPTQDDKNWRKELLRGYPHDETAALLGGVAGSAGLFANAEDLAVLFQMLLEEGKYGNIQYLKPETVELFTSSIENHQRGLGFNKPGLLTASGCSKYASPATFGHSGFTGTCVWVDPNEDLIYIFLSNRIHPNKSNRKLIREHIRSQIHNVVYESLGTFEMELPEMDFGRIGS